MDSEDAVEFILNFYGGAVRLFAAIARIQEVFIYFDRSFLRPKMGFDVGDELTKLLKTLVFDFHGHKLLSLLRQFVDVSTEPRDVYAYLVAAYRRLSPGFFVILSSPLEPRYDATTSQTVEGNCCCWHGFVVF